MNPRRNRSTHPSGAYLLGLTMTTRSACAAAIRPPGNSAATISRRAASCSVHVQARNVPPVTRCNKASRKGERHMKKSLVMALVLGLPVAAIAQQSAAPAPKPTAAKVETQKTQSTETKSESTEKKDGKTTSTKKHHKKTTKKSTSTAPAP